MSLWILSLLFTAPLAVFGTACNADNVLRALKANSASASPFCKTYTLPPPNQPLPTYVSAYPASRVSSACSCFVAPTSTTLTTSTTSKLTSSSTTTTHSVTTSIKTSTTSPTSSSTTSTASPDPTDYACYGDLIRNGGFQITSKAGVSPAKADPWIFDSGSSPGGSSGDSSGYLSVSNGPNSYGASTSLSQHIPTLCSSTQYNLTFTNQISIYGGQPYRDCGVSWSLASTGEIVHIGAPYGEPQPWSQDTRSYVFTYSGYNGQNPKGDTLEVTLSCTAPGGGYFVDDVSLVSLEVYDPGEP
ncbi:MAG: hypothetical protein L6R41_000924 [Letrouitia leprolyta]|nr:MAG: hypothetical protein L6R41_000924 [Letrouitia leprolyta]